MCEFWKVKHGMERSAMEDSPSRGANGGKDHYRTERITMGQTFFGHHGTDLFLQGHGNPRFTGSCESRNICGSWRRAWLPI